MTAAHGAFDPTDAYTRQLEIFPRLSPEMVARISTYGSRETLPKDCSAFERGNRNVDFFVVLEGELEILSVDRSDKSIRVTTVSEREFIGELDLVNERANLVDGRAAVDSEVLPVRRTDFRRLITCESDIGEIVMKAFIVRRVGLIQQRQGGVILIGPTHAGDTVRIQWFLARNGYPPRLIDTDRDEAADDLLVYFDLKRRPARYCPARSGSLTHSVQCGDSRCSGPNREFRSFPHLRCRRDRRRPWRSRNSGLLGLRVYLRSWSKALLQAGRQRAVPELKQPRVSDRKLRTGARQPRASTSPEVRCPSCGISCCSKTQLRRTSL
jgi:CRP-like cAMP-binding protein